MTLVIDQQIEFCLFSFDVILLSYHFNAKWIVYRFPSVALYTLYLKVEDVINFI